MYTSQSVSAVAVVWYTISNPAAMASSRGQYDKKKIEIKCKYVRMYVCVCMFAFLYVYVYVCMNEYMHLCMYTW